MRLTAVIAIAGGVILYFCARPVMIVCSNQKDTMDMSVEYFRIIMGEMVFQSLTLMMNAALRGIGKTKITLLSNSVIGVTDIIFNYFLIGGEAGFPALGVAGAAYATVIGTAFGFVVSLIPFLSHKGFMSLTDKEKLKGFSEREMLRKIRPTVLNLFGENFLMRIGFLISGVIVAHIGSFNTAVYSIGMILMNISIAFGEGLQTACVALIGRCCGADEGEKIPSYLKTALITGAILAVIIASSYALFGEEFFRFFLNDKRFAKMGSSVSLIVAFVCIFQIERSVYIGAMRGEKEVVIPRRIATLCVLVINPLLSYVFGIVMRYGIWGIWISIAIDQVIWFICTRVCYKKFLDDKMK